MWGNDFSTAESGNRIRDTTIFNYENYSFIFKQHDINLKQSKYINQNIVTTTITVENVLQNEIDSILEIIDDICWLLSLAQQSRVTRHEYQYNSNRHFTDCSTFVINALAPIIEMHGSEILNFINQTYENFKRLKSIRILPSIIGYLCEANKHPLALESKLILHYIIIENLKHTFAKEQGYKEKDGKFSHPNYPNLNYLCPNKIEYCFDENTGQWVHKKYSKCRSSEMTRRMFEHIGINRNTINDILKKRNRMIHEGLLLPFGDENYSTQAQKDLNNVNDLLRKYLLTILGYKGEYILNDDRIGASGVIK